MNWEEREFSSYASAVFSFPPLDGQLWHKDNSLRVGDYTFEAIKHNREPFTEKDEQCNKHKENARG